MLAERPERQTMGRAFGPTGTTWAGEPPVVASWGRFRLTATQFSLRHPVIPPFNLPPWMVVAVRRSAAGCLGTDRGGRRLRPSERPALAGGLDQLEVKPGAGWPSIRWELENRMKFDQPADKTTRSPRRHELPDNAGFPDPAPSSRHPATLGGSSTARPYRAEQPG